MRPHDTSLLAWLEQQADVSAARIHAPSWDSSLVEQHSAGMDNALPRLTVGQPFWLEFYAEASCQLLVLQHAQRVWAPVPIAPNALTKATPRGWAPVPNRPSFEDQPMLVEHRDTGVHHFVGIMSAQPLPPGLLSALATLAPLDAPTTAALLAWMRQAPSAKLHIAMASLLMVATS
jgi:hypothetical protein